MLAVNVNTCDVVILVVDMFALRAKTRVLKHTATGRVMRDAFPNREGAGLVGLNVPVLSAITLGLSSASAALVAIFVGALRFVSPEFAADILIRSLIVAIEGGVVRFSAHVCAALFVGNAESSSS